MSLVSTSIDSLDRRQHGASAVDHDVRASVLRCHADLDAIAHRWHGLEQNAPGLTMYQSLGWARAVFDFESGRGNKDFDPVIATIEDGQRLVGVLPLERVRTRARTVLVPLGFAFGQISDVLLDADVDPKSGVARLLKVAIEAAPSDGLSLLKVRADSMLARGLPATAIETGEAQGAPYVGLDAFPDFASYFSTVRSKTRKNMRNARNRLERDGVVEHRVLVRPSDQLALIERTLDGRADRLKEQGLTSRAFHDGGFIAFCKGLVGRPDIALMAFSFVQDGHPLAEQWGFVQNGRYYAFMASRDFSQSDESPGKLHLREILEVCAERRLQGCDLGVPVMPYKLTFATETVGIRDYALPVTPRGWLTIRIWDILLRPNLKRLVLGMPASWRARLMRLVGHGNRV